MVFGNKGGDGCKSEDAYHFEWYAALAASLGHRAIGNERKQHFEWSAILAGVAQQMRRQTGRGLHSWEDTIQNLHLNRKEAEATLNSSEYDVQIDKGKSLTHDRTPYDWMCEAIAYFDKKLDYQQEWENEILDAFKI